MLQEELLKMILLFYISTFFVRIDKYFIINIIYSLLIRKIVINWAKSNRKEEMK